MLGTRIDDPDGVEGPPGTMEGLGLLDVVTQMTGEKRLAETSAHHVATDTGFLGYEIHKGRTLGPDCSRPFARMDNGPEGARSASGQVAGSYFHGMFRTDAFRTAYLRMLGAEAASFSYSETVDQTLNALATHIETHLNVDGLLALAR